MKNALTIFLVLIILSSSCEFMRKKGWIKKSKAKQEAVSMAMQDSIRVADSLRAVTEKMGAIEQARLDSVSAVEQAKYEREARYKYHIIVGSFLTPEYAEDYMRYYKLLGYDAQIIDGPQNRFNFVSAEGHDNLDDAIRRLYQFQDTVEFEAWLYIKQ